MGNRTTSRRVHRGGWTVTTANLSSAALFDLLADRRRRFALAYLADAADGAVTFEALAEAVAARECEGSGVVPDDRRTDVEVSLHHNHLPRLADAGLVEYDRGTGTVRYRGNDRLDARLGDEDDERATEGDGPVDGFAFGFTPEQAEVARAEVRAHDLPDAVADLVEEYDRTVGDRDRFLWKWLHHLFPRFTLSCVDPSDVDRVRNAKLVASLFVALLDDVAEKHRDGTTFEEAAKIPFAHQTVEFDRDGADAEFLRFARRVWDRFEATFEQGERAAEFADVLRFDVGQVVDSMEYSHLINEDLAVASYEELRVHDPYNMMLFVYVDVDLAFSPSFDRSDLPALRGVVLKAQEMARIGNWVTTWEREVAENDFSSGVVVRAVEEGVVDREDLARLRAGELDAGSDALVEAIADRRVEAEFVEQWAENRRQILRRAGGVESVDVESFVEGMDAVMRHHLASRGLK